MFDICLIKEGLEVSDISDDMFVTVFDDFICFLEIQEKYGEVMYWESSLAVHDFSYGNYFNDLLGAAWNTFSQNKAFKQVSQNQHQLFVATRGQLFCANEITQASWDTIKPPKAYAGFKKELEYAPYIYSKKTWMEWRVESFQHLDYFQSTSSCDERYLPNVEFSNLFLSYIVSCEKDLELSITESALLESILPTDTKYIVDNVFYPKMMKVMRPKEREAFITFIGGLICLMNGYKYEVELSNKEEKRCKSKRKIYSKLETPRHKQYISLDFKHGMFEYHDHHGKHLGEYRFNGIFNKDGDKKKKKNTHDIQIK